MKLCNLNFLIYRFELLCRTVITQDSNRSSSSPKYVSVLRELPNKFTVYENTYIRGWICDANVQKHQFSNLPAY